MANGINILIPIIAVVIALVIAVPVACKLAVAKKVKQDRLALRKKKQETS